MMLASTVTMLRALLMASKPDDSGRSFMSAAVSLLPQQAELVVLEKTHLSS